MHVTRSRSERERERDRIAYIKVRFRRYRHRRMSKDFNREEALHFMLMFMKIVDEYIHEG